MLRGVFPGQWAPASLGRCRLITAAFCRLSANADLDTLRSPDLPKAQFYSSAAPAPGAAPQAALGRLLQRSAGPRDGSPRCRGQSGLWAGTRPGHATGHVKPPAAFSFHGVHSFFLGS